MLNIKKLLIASYTGCLLFMSSQVEATDIVSVNTHGNSAEAIIELPGGVSADITLEFENAVGLTAQNLGISAEVVDITSQALLQRLPSITDIAPAAAFPMMITIEPQLTSGFSFSGLATVDIHTHNLEYTAGTPLRFFKAPLNGEFKDITMTMGAGSYRARGSTGRFSQFIIVADLRPQVTVIDSKYNDLQTALNNFSADIDPAVYSALLQDLADVNQLMLLQNYSAASNKLNSFNRRISDNSGDKVPNVWRSSRDISNVAGELMAYANTLRFSLRLAN
ncbi:MAG TPA: hypothetical protein DEF74_05565 [Pseudoalteromonas sp.]|uniref:DUF6689 family protein n=1 Tax=uncultured Pseudoalteromonas sp. TaxID=114053 RepID=UPI000E862529|nr:hypothetical protein [Pseudoalteromonas sp.]